MRHVILVVASSAQLQDSAPRIKPRDGEVQRETTWYACKDQDNPVNLLGDASSCATKILRAPFLAYDLYQQVHSTKLWSGKRPLIVVRDRGFASRVAAYAGKWGGGDVAMPAVPDQAPLGPTRYVFDADGNLRLRDDTA